MSYALRQLIIDVTLAFSFFKELNDPSQKIVEESIGRLRDKMGEDEFKKALDSFGGS